MLSILVREDLGYLIQSEECTCPASPYQEEWDRSYLSGFGQDSHRLNQDFKAERLKRKEREQGAETSGYPCDVDMIRTENKCFASLYGF